MSGGLQPNPSSKQVISRPAQAAQLFPFIHLWLTRGHNLSSRLAGSALANITRAASSSSAHHQEPRAFPFPLTKRLHHAFAMHAHVFEQEMRYSGCANKILTGFK